MSAMSGAASGAMQGFAIGGPWGAAIGGALGFLAGDAEEDARYEAAQAQLQAAQKRNEALLAEAARGIGEINRQRTTAFIKSNQAMLHYRRQASSESSSLANQYAAADVIGKSAVIVQTDIAMQRDAALSQELFNVEVQQENFNVAVDNLTNATKSQFADATAAIDELYQGTDAMSEMFGILKQGAGMYMGGKLDRSLNSAGLGGYAWNKASGTKIGSPGKVGSVGRNMSNVLSDQLGVQG